jgi:inhibitor of KinA
MNDYQPYSVFPLGDSALTIDFGNIINEDINKKVLKLFHHLKSSGDPYILDLVPAYSSLTVCYDVASVHHQEQTSFESMADRIEQLLLNEHSIQEQKSNYFEIPVCYSKKFAIDIDEVSRRNEIAQEDIIRLHSSTTYRVYMLGFLPGFTYMGEVDHRIVVERKPVPVKLFAGAVGIAGKQTGIYPLESPGGWQIIGRTPVEIFSKDSQQPVLFQPGDEVKFYPITEHEFANYQARRS